MCRRASRRVSAHACARVCFRGALEAVECCSERGEAGHFYVDVSDVDVAGDLGQVHVLHGRDSACRRRRQSALSKERGGGGDHRFWTNENSLIGNVYVNGANIPQFGQRESESQRYYERGMLYFKCLIWATFCTRFNGSHLLRRLQMQPRSPPPPSHRPRLTSDFSKRFCTSTCATISFMLVSSTMPPITTSCRM